MRSPSWRSCPGRAARGPRTRRGGQTPGGSTRRREAETWGAWDSLRDGRGLRAAAAARRDEDQTEVRAFAPGERVRHNTFGVGTVIGCQAVPGDMQVTVACQGQGVKKMLQSFARLGPANEDSA